MNDLINKAKNYYISNLRAFPCFIIVYSILTGLLFQNKLALFFGVYMFIVDCIVMVLKKISNHVYKSFNKESLPILGIGKRPDNAKYTGCFITEDNLSGKTTTFGMPSGHSAIAGATFVFGILYIHEHYKSSKAKNLSYLILSVLCLSVAFSRIFLNCHTLQQVIVGFIIGGGFGFAGYVIYKQYIENDKLKKILFGNI